MEERRGGHRFSEQNSHYLLSITAGSFYSSSLFWLLFPSVMLSFPICCFHSLDPLLFVLIRHFFFFFQLFLLLLILPFRELLTTLLLFFFLFVFPNYLLSSNFVLLLLRLSLLLLVPPLTYTIGLRKHRRKKRQLGRGV